MMKKSGTFLGKVSAHTAFMQHFQSTAELKRSEYGMSKIFVDSSKAGRSSRYLAPVFPAGNPPSRLICKMFVTESVRSLFQSFHPKCDLGKRCWEHF